MTDDIAPVCTMPQCDEPAVVDHDRASGGMLCAKHRPDFSSEEQSENDGSDGSNNGVGSGSVDTTTENDAEPRPSNENLSHGADEPIRVNDHDHQNPVDAANLTDEERARMLLNYLDAFRAEFGTTPLLMPLDAEGKAPWIANRYSLDSPEADAVLVDGYEAARQMHHEGARGFAIYAGRSDHGTENVAFVDHDTDAFPAPTGKPTLEILSGSGRGTHETYRNASDDPVRNARVGDNEGEIRAENWYVIVPGSIHPTGGVYHIVENRDVATLADADLDDSMRPSTARNRERTASEVCDIDGEGDRPDDSTIADRLDAAFANDHDGERIRQVYNGRYQTAGFDDRSAAEFWLANRLDSWVGRGNTATVERVMDSGNLQKWEERTDRSYRDSVLANVGTQDWYYDSENDDECPSRGPEPVPAIPFSMLSRPHDVMVRYARKRGLEWPSTDEARNRLGESLHEALSDEGYAVLDAPTGLGKTHEVSTTFWREVDESVTGGQPVVLFASTTDARDEARRMALDAGLEVKTLLGYKEACDVAGGAFDPENIDEDDNREPRYIEGVPAGHWFETHVENKGIAVSSAHAKAERLADRGYVATSKEESANGRGNAVLPCCPAELKCHTETQWPSDGWTNDIQVRCPVFDHSVEDCSDCHTARVRCNDAGTHGHSVDECPDCSENRVRCDRHDPDHTAEDCSDCHTDSSPRYDLVIATDPFAYVPGLRSNMNIIHDEQPDYTVEFGDTDEQHQQRIQRAVTAFLKAADAPAQADTFGGLIQVGKHGFSFNEHANPDEQPDMGRRYDDLFDALQADLPQDWYFEHENAHTLASALAQAIYKAAGEDCDKNGRRTATVAHEPPRLDADASNDDAWNRTWLTVVLDDEDNVVTVRDAPDFSTTRNVIGLDAWPNPYLWQRNVHPATTVNRVLDTEERSLWRRIEQGKIVVGVGDATRPPGKEGEYFTEEHADAVIAQLRSEFGDDFQAAGCASAIEDRIRELLSEHGADLPADPGMDFTDTAYDGGAEGGTMHYGEENSRNDLAEYTVGLVYGCIDPGDDYVLNLAAECDLDVRPATHECPECGGTGCGPSNPGCRDGERRNRGREFTGGDGDTAAGLLASVRENHVAQMVGRFGRAKSVDQSVVFVATDATPSGLVDVTVPGVLWLARPNQKQRDLVEHLRNPGQDNRTTARGAADAVDCTKEHARQVFRALVKQGKATVYEGTGAEGADEYRWSLSSMANANPFATVDLTPGDIPETTTNCDVLNSYTWELVMSTCPAREGAVKTTADVEHPSLIKGQTSLRGFTDVEPPP